MRPRRRDRRPAPRGTDPRGLRRAADGVEPTQLLHVARRRVPAVGASTRWLPCTSEQAVHVATAGGHLRDECALRVDRQLEAARRADDVGARIGGADAVVEHGFHLRGERRRGDLQLTARGFERRLAIRADVPQRIGPADGEDRRSRTRGTAAPARADAWSAPVGAPAIPRDLPRPNPGLTLHQRYARARRRTNRTCGYWSTLLDWASATMRRASSARRNPSASNASAAAVTRRTNPA